MSFDFTLLRLLLALSVVLAHFRELTGQHDAAFTALSATVAVQAFFVVSGWIVSASYEASSSAGAFFVRRMARLYPLYAAVVLAQAAIAFALVMPRPGAFEELLQYLGANLAFANFLKPGFLDLLDGAPVGAINPSLWTMKVEVLFYLSVPLWVLLARRLGSGGLVLLFCASTAYATVVEAASEELARQLPGQLRFFIAGMLCRRLWHPAPQAAPRRPLPLALLGVAGMLLAQRFDQPGAMSALQPLFVAAFVAASARLLPRLPALPDLSFGVYLLHAPVIQFAQHAGVLPSGAAGLASVLAVTLLLSMAANRWIEEPAIRAGARLSRRLSSPGAAQVAAIAPLKEVK
ncbi:acyltransferase family protein [Azohydromonas aeria]|uniref:acyltransferase family protein n=1 Tax=Azohydromonas aeria TaxID=2590212 RepID=UPI0012FCF7E3|nr:acyltransferase [Azohydromonas aeria]